MVASSKLCFVLNSGDFHIALGQVVSVNNFRDMTVEIRFEEETFHGYHIRAIPHPVLEMSANPLQCMKMYMFHSTAEVVGAMKAHQNVWTKLKIIPRILNGLKHHAGHKLTMDVVDIEIDFEKREFRMSAKISAEGMAKQIVQRALHLDQDGDKPGKYIGRATIPWPDEISTETSTTVFRELFEAFVHTFCTDQLLEDMLKQPYKSVVLQITNGTDILRVKKWNATMWQTLISRLKNKEAWDEQFVVIDKVVEDALQQPELVELFGNAREKLAAKKT